MYVILRKRGEKVLIDGQELTVTRIEDKNVLFSLGKDVFDFMEGGSFLLAENIKVQAVRVSNNAARVGIAAPREVSILRC